MEIITSPLIEVYTNKLKLITEKINFIIAELDLIDNIPLFYKTQGSVIFMTKNRSIYFISDGDKTLFVYCKNDKCYKINGDLPIDILPIRVNKWVNDINKVTLSINPYENGLIIGTNDNNYFYSAITDKFYKIISYFNLFNKKNGSPIYVPIISEHSLILPIKSKHEDELYEILRREKIKVTNYYGFYTIETNREKIIVDMNTDHIETIDSVKREEKQKIKHIIFNDEYHYITYDNDNILVYTGRDGQYEYHAVLSKFSKNQLDVLKSKIRLILYELKIDDERKMKFVK